MTNFEEAVCFAVAAHQGTRRKGETTPYILHPMEAASICATVTSDQDVLTAAVLHDTVEDTDVTLAQIAERFGARVAQLVASETEDKRPEMPPEESWQLRKQESLERLKNAEDPGVKVLWLGDKLSNIRSFHRAWRVGGHGIWQAFNQKDPARQAWYYRRIVELLQELCDYDAWQELHRYVEQIFEGV